MGKLEVTKTIEARKLNKRTRLAMSEPPVTIPYGAILEDVVENRESLEFMYLGELYSANGGILRAASHPLDGPVAVSAPAAAAAPARSADPLKFVWEAVAPGVSRAKLPGGWLIAVGEGRSVTFYPDPQHAWDGKTI
jgi:hypothetical protein